MDQINSLILLKYLCFAGSGLATLGVLISAWAYRGKQGETYSPLNHFISELGEKGVSRLAWVFNLSLILTGLSVLPASILLGLLIPGVWSKIGLISGAVSAIALSLVGFFPMNDMNHHAKAAIAFFRAGLIMVLSFTLAILFQKGESLFIPRAYGLAGVPSVIAFATFLVLMWKAYKSTDDPLAADEHARPKVWRMAVSEWAIFLTIVLWFLVIALGL